MDKNDPRYQNLVRASEMTRVQKENIKKQLDALAQEDLIRLQNEQYELENESGFKCVGADDDSDASIFVNYNNMPQNQNSKRELWEESLATGAPKYYTTPFGIQQQQAQQQQNIYRLPNGAMPFGLPQQPMYNPMLMGMDRRVQMYNSHPGMRFYNLNPYQFMDEKHLEDYYNFLEENRKKDMDQKYYFATFGIKKGLSDEDIHMYDDLIFKPADDIIKDRERAQQEEQARRYREIYGDPEHPKTVYDVYDSNGYRFKRSFRFKLIDVETGKVVRDCTNKKTDENGHGYEIRHISEDRKEQFEQQKVLMEMHRALSFWPTFLALLDQDYAKYYNLYSNLAAQGYGPEERQWKVMDMMTDWKKHEAMIDRSIRMATFSKENFHDILSKFCHTELIYSNKGDFFGIGYDYERDLHYKSLLSTVEEMDNDPAVHDKLKQEFDKRRSMFMDKVDRRDFKCCMATDYGFNPNALPKPNIDNLTLEDYNKPENQVMYNEFEGTDRSFKNMFIPDSKTLNGKKAEQFIEDTTPPPPPSGIEEPDINNMTEEEIIKTYYM